MLPALLIATLLLSSPEDSSQRQLVDRIVAVIDQQPLLLSELEFEARVALISQGGSEAVDAPLGIEVLRRTLDYVIGQRLAHAEADRLQVFAVTDDDVTKALKGFAQRFPNDLMFKAFLARQEATEEQLASLLRRDLRVARYLESRVRVAARVTEEEIRRFYTARPEEFAERGYVQVREGIKNHLTRQRIRELAARQLDELRGRADIRLLGPFATVLEGEAVESPDSQDSPDTGTAKP